MKVESHINRSCRGLSLIEVMVAIVIILAAVIGATRYRYYTALDARKAALYSEASRLALTMLEGWKGAGSEKDFDPFSDFANGYGVQFIDSLNIVSSSDGEPPAELPNPVGSYVITTDKARYFLTLSYEDEDENDDIPAALNVSARWAQRSYTQADFSDTDKSLSITTYQGY